MLRQFFNKSNNDKIQLYNSSCIQNKWLQMQQKVLKLEQKSLFSEVLATEKEITILQATKIIFIISMIYSEPLGRQRGINYQVYS